MGNICVSVKAEAGEDAIEITTSDGTTEQVIGTSGSIEKVIMDKIDIPSPDSMSAYELMSPRSGSLRTSHKASVAGSGGSDRRESCASDATIASDMASLFVVQVDTIEYQQSQEIHLPDWYIDAAQELLRTKGILKTDVTYYQSMDFSQKADVWCNEKQDMVDKVEICGCLLKGCEKMASDGSKWIALDEHHFLPVLIQGCRVVFSGDVKFKPIINEWVIDTTKELRAKDVLGVGWYFGMDIESDVVANSTKANGKVVKGSTTFDKKGIPWICVDTSIGFYMPIFIDGKQVAFPKED